MSIHISFAGSQKGFKIDELVEIFKTWVDKLGETELVIQNRPTAKTDILISETGKLPKLLVGSKIKVLTLNDFIDKYDDQHILAKLLNGSDETSSKADLYPRMREIIKLYSPKHSTKTTSKSFSSRTETGSPRRTETKLSSTKTKRSEAKSPKRTEIPDSFGIRHKKYIPLE